MDVLEVLGNTGLTTAGVLLLREVVIGTIALWSMRKSIDDKRREQALALLCILAPRRAEKLRARLASVKARVPRPRKASKNEIVVSKAVDPEPAVSGTSTSA
jgi:hypothetical protein